jgi:hypothetical protein
VKAHGVGEVVGAKLPSLQASLPLQVLWAQAHPAGGQDADVLPEHEESPLHTRFSAPLEVAMMVASLQASLPSQETSRSCVWPLARMSVLG